MIDLNSIPDETLREAYYWFGAAALTAKHIRDFDLVSLLKNMVDLLKRLKDNGLEDYVYITLSYVFTEGEIKDRESFRDVIRSGLSSKDEERVMTLAEQYRQEGKIETLHETAISFLKLGVSIEQVSQATKLPLQEVQDLWKKSASVH